ncbi:hypothetical protein SASPL_148412 [Salvia splendens]|uniref:Phosphotransferase n=1 Tax=Salvia splendens TaxID=180675 RepID=A0A8X8Z428_SALSN|nr:hypothetical protein SASPL_148412 [Salvia splendens]
MSVITATSAAPPLHLPRSGTRPRVAMMVRSSNAVSAASILTKLRNDCATPLPLLRQVSDAMAADMRLRSQDDPQLRRFPSHRELFNFIASKLAKFVDKEGGKFESPQGRTREVGFTFSFAVKQTSINSGVLIKWTKGFAVSGTEGRDVVACLNEAMRRQGLNMRVSALVHCHSCCGLVCKHLYWDDDVMVAVILGTGTNACYVERVDNIPKLRVPKSAGGSTIFEKTISGMYLGEIVRRVLHRMAEDATLFGDSIPEKLQMPFSLKISNVCTMQQDSSKDLEVVGSILYDVAGVNSNLESRKIVVVDICETIAKRGGRLAGAGIVGILQKMEGDSKGAVFGKRTVVAMDGGLYEHYPEYRGQLQDAVTELLGPEISKNAIVQHSKDGSGIGAALLAATNSIYQH